MRGMGDLEDTTELGYWSGDGVPGLLSGRWGTWEVFIEGLRTVNTLTSNE